MNYFAVAESGTVTYGGRPSNPTAPFLGVDPENGEWSVCTPGSGVTNYQSGYLRLADFPADQADDFFIPFTCKQPNATPKIGANGPDAIQGGDRTGTISGRQGRRCHPLCWWLGLRS